MCFVLGKLLVGTVNSDSIAYTCTVDGSHVLYLLPGDDKEPVQVLIGRLEKAVSEECCSISKVKCYFKSGFGQEVPTFQLLIH